MPKRRKPKAEATLKTVIIKALIGSAIGTVLFFALIALTSLICLKGDSDPASYKFFVLAAGAVSGFICGFASVKPVKKKGIIAGALSTLPMCFIAVCTAMLISHGGLGLIGWILCAVMLASGGVGGIIAVN